MFWVDGEASQGPKRDPYAHELTLTPDFPAPTASFAIPQPIHGMTGPGRRRISADLSSTNCMSALGAGRTRQASTLARRGAVAFSTSRRASATSATSASTPFSCCRSRNSRPNSARGTTGSTILAGGNLPSQLRRGSRLVPRPDQRDACRLRRRALTLDQLRPGVNQLKCLIDLAHLHEIAVIFDLVYNHAGGGFDPQSLWFYDRFDNGDQNNSLYFTDQGWAGGLVFAYWNANVRQFLIDNASAFIKEYRIDGIRYDEVRVISDNRPGGFELCQDVTGTVRFIRPSAIQIAEYWDWDRALPVTPVPAGLGFDAALGDAFRDAVRSLLVQAAGGDNAELSLTLCSRARPAGGLQRGLASCAVSRKSRSAPTSGMTAPPACRCLPMRRTGDPGMRAAEAGRRRRCSSPRRESRPCSWDKKSWRISCGATTRQTILAI